MGRSIRWGLLAGWVIATLAGVAAASSGSFIDDDGNIHEANIEAIAAEGITKGCNPPINDRYCPGQPTSRAQMASFLVRAFDYPATDEQFFTDTAGNVHEADINALAAAQVTFGCNPPANNLYCPEESASRAEMASFLVRAAGLQDGAGSDFFVDDDGSVHEDDIDRLRTAGLTFGCNPPDNDRYCPGDPVLRDQMASFLARALDLQPVPPPPPPVLNTVATGLSQPLLVTAPPGDPRLFIVEKTGAIRIVAGGELLAEPFLDLSDRVSTGSEQGLLGMAFHPAYAQNGRFFVHFTNVAGDTRLVEFQVSSDDPNRADLGTERQVLDLEQPASNHNGGMVLFGPDGYLYLALGDGGGSGDPNGNGQDPHTLLGSILRLDVDGAHPYEIPPDNPFVDGGGAPEVWAYGLRNPWRISIDPPAGLLYVADVGQNSWEEVSVEAAGAGALNYGWSIMEGAHCFDPAAGCDQSGLELPVLEYPIPEEGCAVIGGFVYRGSALTHLQGHYFYGDLCGGWIRSFRYQDGQAAHQTEWFQEVGSILSFGTDAAGELYVTVAEGTVYRLAAGS
jgi:glucose/arabinose dehydrogenase